MALELAEPDPEREPSRRLSGRAQAVWALHQAGAWALVWLAAAFAAKPVDAPWSTLLYALPPVALAVAVFAVPRLRWSRWRWDVRTDGIDIRHGTLTIRRTLVPWVRVQHVDTRQGLLEQQLKLATVVVHTAAGSHTIPLLDEFDAGLLRNRIAELARA